jgi:hypothetical protein
MQQYQIRIYKDDNSIFDPEYVAIVDKRDCYVCKIMQMNYPSATEAHVRLYRRIPCPHSGLLDYSVTALDGWSFLLEQEDITHIDGACLLDYPEAAPFPVEHWAKDGWVAYLPAIISYPCQWSWGAIVLPPLTQAVLMEEQLAPLLARIGIHAAPGSLALYNLDVVWIPTQEYQPQPDLH